MNSTRLLVIALTLILSGHMASAQNMSRYRGYALASSLESVMVASGAHATDVKTLHERPARIQELTWRAPYRGSEPLADPVRAIGFTFYNDALYRIVVDYDRNRTEGLSSKDLIESISGEYGRPLLATAKAGAAPAVPDGIVLARWDSTEAQLTLVRGLYTPEFKLILVSTPLGTRAQAAIQEAIRLDAIEAPRREAERRKQEADDASAARDETRLTNKAAFRP